VTPLCGAFEAQRQYLRQRSAGRHALRKAIQRTDDRGIRMHLATLEEQRARHVRSEWSNLRKIQQMLEGELDLSLDLDSGFGSPMEEEGDFEGGLHELQQKFKGARGRPPPAAAADPLLSPTHQRVDTTSVVTQHRMWLQNFTATH
jgi:hypothetical protein